MIEKHLRLSCLALLFPTILTAQVASPPLVTDRPDQTESAVTVRPGAVQVETGLTFTQDAESGTRVRHVELPSTLIRIGVVDRLEARIGFAGWQRAEERVAGTTATADGIGDLDLGVKIRLADEARGRPELALIAATSLPVGADGFGSERSDPTVLIAAANTLSDVVGIGYNVGLQWSTVGSGEAAPDPSLNTMVHALYTVAFGFALAENVGAFAEAFGAVGLESGAPDPVSLDGGLTFGIRDNVQLDISAGVGLNRAADDWFVGAGVAIRVPR